MTRIRVAPEQLREAARVLTARAEEMRGLAANLRSLPEGLPSYEGQFRPRVRALAQGAAVRLLGEAERVGAQAEGLLRTAEAFERADQETGRRLNWLGEMVRGWMEEAGPWLGRYADLLGLPWPSVEGYLRLGALFGVSSGEQVAQREDWALPATLVPACELRLTPTPPGDAEGSGPAGTPAPPDRTPKPQRRPTPPAPAPTGTPTWEEAEARQRAAAERIERERKQEREWLMREQPLDYIRQYVYLSAGIDYLAWALSQQDNPVPLEVINDNEAYPPSARAALAMNAVDEANQEFLSMLETDSKLLPNYEPIYLEALKRHWHKEYEEALTLVDDGLHDALHEKFFKRIIAPYYNE
jgi:hypothetical protein